MSRALGWRRDPDGREKNRECRCYPCRVRLSEGQNSLHTLKMCEQRTILSEGVSGNVVNPRDKITWNRCSDLVTVPMLEHISVDTD